MERNIRARWQSAGASAVRCQGKCSYTVRLVHNLITPKDRGPEPHRGNKSTALRSKGGRDIAVGQKTRWHLACNDAETVGVSGGKNAGPAKQAFAHAFRRGKGAIGKASNLILLQRTNSWL